VLFRAQAGTLTEQSKGLSRQRRLKQAKNGRTAYAEFDDWETRDFAFTLYRLKNPDAEGKIILAAIRCSKTGIMPKPGHAIRATAIGRGTLVAQTYT
jgi:hypothetical protein